MPEPTDSLDQTIQHAVMARIEAEVAKAMMGDDAMATFITAALQQPVETDRYNRGHKQPYIKTVLAKAIRDATSDAVAKMLQEEQERFEDEIRKALRREAPSIASAMVESLVETAQSAYGIKISLDTEGGRR